MCARPGTSGSPSRWSATGAGCGPRAGTRPSTGRPPASRRHRGDAFGMFSCSKATNEMNYVAQKFARVVMGSNNVDSCNRT